MVVLTRVDFRLLHGQIAFSWVSNTQADCILVASDQVVTNEIWKTSLRLAKPNNCKLVMKNMSDSIQALNSGVTDKYRLLILVQSIQEAKQLLDGCPQIKKLNLGNTREKPGSRQLHQSVFVDPEEIGMLQELVHRGVDVEIRPTASDKGVSVRELL